MFTIYSVEQHWCFFNIIIVLVHLLLTVFIVLFTLITVLISLKTVVVVHRVEGASLRAVVVVVTYRLMVGDVLFVEPYIDVLVFFYH
jgi:hypothetical protein